MIRIISVEAPGYNVIERLGEGATGNYFEVQDDKNKDNIFALKIIPGNPLRDSSNAYRMLEGVRRKEGIDLSQVESRTGYVLSMLKHPNLANYRANINDITIVEENDGIERERKVDGLLFDIIRGETLLSLQERKKELSLGEIVSIFSQTTKGVAAIHHAGFFHRDIKPENIMLEKSGLVKVVDYGIAMGDDITGDYSGDREYQAPETLDGKFDARSEVWSLGVLLYELCLRERPFQCEKKSEMKDVLNNPKSYDSLERKLEGIKNKRIQRILRKCLRYDPDERFQSVGELGRDFGKVRRFRRKLKKINFGKIGKAVWNKIKIPAYILLGSAALYGLFLTGDASWRRFEGNRIIKEYEKWRANERGWIEDALEFRNKYPTFESYFNDGGENFIIEGGADTSYVKWIWDDQSDTTNLALRNERNKAVKTFEQPMYCLADDLPEILITSANLEGATCYWILNGVLKKKQEAEFLRRDKSSHYVYGFSFDFKKRQENDEIVYFIRNAQMETDTSSTRTVSDRLADIYTKIIFISYENRAPRIDAYKPEKRFFETSEKDKPVEFKVDVKDELRPYRLKHKFGKGDEAYFSLVDLISRDDVSFSWFLDNVPLSNDKDRVKLDFQVIDPGNHRVKCVVNDGVFESTQEWNVLVKGNYSPSIITVFPERFFKGDPYPDVPIGVPINFAANVEDLDGDSLYYKWVVLQEKEEGEDVFEEHISLGSNVTLLTDSTRVISQGKKFTFTPNSQHNGYYHVVFSVSDGRKSEVCVGGLNVSDEPIDLRADPYSYETFSPSRSGEEHFMYQVRANFYNDSPYYLENIPIKFGIPEIDLMLDSKISLEPGNKDQMYLGPYVPFDKVKQYYEKHGNALLSFCFIVDSDNNYRESDETNNSCRGKIFDMSGPFKNND